MGELISTNDNGILNLVLNVPAKKNALTDALRTQLRDALRDAQENAAVRAMVISGAGGSFSSGGDISAMTGDADIACRRMEILHEVVRCLMTGSKPAVAAVGGAAFGAGFSLALCCDQVIADDTARFSASFGRIGLPPDLALSWNLPRRIGDARARRLLLSCGIVEAQEAADLGIVDTLVASENLLAEAHRRATEMAAFTQESKAHVKALLTAAAGSLDDLLAREMDSYIALLSSAEHHAAREAFLSKSKRNG